MTQTAAEAVAVVPDDGSRLTHHPDAATGHSFLPALRFAVFVAPTESVFYAATQPAPPPKVTTNFGLSEAEDQ